MKDKAEDSIPLPKRWVKCDVESEYFGDDRKKGKEERKRAKAKDRSQYKKTDRDKHLVRETTRHENLQIRHESLLRGRVISITPQGFCVECENKLYTCILKGLLKKERSLLKNLVVTGDFVRFEITTEGEGLISYVEPRHSLLSRADNLSRRKEQLIASNIDQVLITVSVVSPPLKSPIVDRYIIAARKGKMDPVIIVNKIDLLDDPSFDEQFRLQEREYLELFLDAYKKADVPVICVSASSGQGLEDLKERMKNKASVFSGQSGVGKSSLINMVAGLDLRTGIIVEKTKKGAHTTTTARLLPLDFGGWCIDTPGIKSFGVWNLQTDEVENYFPEIQEVGHQCKFPDCSHMHEHGCAVHTAVEQGGISLLRYESYLFLMASVSQEHLRR